MRRVIRRTMRVLRRKLVRKARSRWFNNSLIRMLHARQVHRRPLPVLKRSIRTRRVRLVTFWGSWRTSNNLVSESIERPLGLFSRILRQQVKLKSKLNNLFSSRWLHTKQSFISPRTLKKLRLRKRQLKFRRIRLIRRKRRKVIARFKFPCARLPLLVNVQLRGYKGNRYLEAASSARRNPVRTHAAGRVISGISLTNSVARVQRLLGPRTQLVDSEARQVKVINNRPIQTAGARLFEHFTTRPYSYELRNRRVGSQIYAVLTRVDFTRAERKMLRRGLVEVRKLHQSSNQMLEYTNYSQKLAETAYETHFEIQDGLQFANRFRNFRWSV